MFKFLLYSCGLSCILAFTLIGISFFLIASPFPVCEITISLAIVSIIYYAITAFIIKSKYKKELEELK